jgi:4-hydroxy-4-methyl-2-oxoglutarate aldolase
MKIIKDLENISTTCFSDALDYFGVNGCVRGIAPLCPRMHTVGKVFTVKYTLDDNKTFTPTTNYPDEVSENDVIVIDNGGKDFCTVWGGMLTLGAIRSKARGVIINGCCRDADEILELNFPTFSSGIFMRTGKSRVKLEFIQKPIVIDSVTISPNDLICADINGVVVVPHKYINQVTSLAIALDENDKKITEAVKAGESLSEAKHLYSYDKFAKQFMSTYKK